jgi:hypothetical protein
MKRVKKMAVQGDVLFVRVDKLPRGLRKTENRVVAHSESGHHHVAVGDSCVLLETSNPLRAFLDSGGKVVDIIHQRSFDTHEPLRLSPGLWEIHRQAEPGAAPSSWVQVSD